jgi:hypothetical protein
MDLIVCGEALWISCGTWIAFWNGSIGALVGAGVAAYAIVKRSEPNATFSRSSYRGTTRKLNSLIAGGMGS